MPLVTRVEGTKGGLPNQHGALHHALITLLHDQLEVLAEVCLGFEIIKSGKIHVYRLTTSYEA